MMFIKEHTMFVEKYRPTSLDTYIGNETVKNTFKQYIETGDVPHLLLFGSAGCGKTTIAKIICNSIAKDNYLYINASDENSIDTVRDKIKQFASTVGFGGLKIIILDEAEFMSANGQAALRNIMETFSKTTRFILTCNYIDKIIDPIQSRCQIFNIVPPSRKDVAIHVSNILKIENIEFTADDVATIVTANYPDIRRVINTTQRCILDGKLKLDSATLVEHDYHQSIVDILKSTKDNKAKFSEIRQHLADNYVRDYVPLFRYLYDNVAEYAKKNISTAILIIAESQYKDALVVDHEINAMAMFIQLIVEIDK